MKTAGALDIVKTIALMLVVVGHAEIVKTNSGGVVCLVDSLSPLIYTFHMALFFIASGAVYDRCLKAGKYDKISNLFLKKSKRLLYPFVLFCFAIATHVWYFTRADLESTYDEVFFDTITCENGQYLWFLAVLFLCFMCVRLLEQSVRHKGIIMTLLLFLSFVKIDVEIIRRLFMYLPWFYCGRLFYNKIDWNRYAKWLAGLFPLFLATYFFYNKLGMSANIKYTYFMLMSMLACLSTIGTACLLERCKLSGYAISRIINYGFEIYLLSCPIQIIYFHFEKQMFEVWHFNAFVSVLFFLVQILLTLFICVLCAPFVRKVITWND